MILKEVFPAIIILLITSQSCSPKSAPPRASFEEKTSSEQPKKDGYYIDENLDGWFERIELDENPVPFMGLEEFYKKLYTEVRYPAEARQQGIEGDVILQPFIDENGFVIDVEIKQSLCKPCDDNVLSAFKKTTQNGYAKLMWNSNYVRYKFDLTFKFRLP